MALVVLVSALAAPAFAWTSPKLDPLLSDAASLLTGQSRVVVTAKDHFSLDAVAWLIQLLGGSLGPRLPIIHAQAATVPNVALQTLTLSHLVRRVSLDRPVAGLLERTGHTVGATGVREELGLDGSGIGIAVIDSGVMSGADDLSDPATGSQRIARFVDFVRGRSAPYDDYGHGTHVAGIIAGNGFDSGGARSGLAPGSRLVVLKVLDRLGKGRISNVIAALDYVVRHRSSFNIRLVNLSVGAGVYESYEDDPLTVAALRVVEAGIVVVAAAGNLGRDAQGRKVYGAITAPGNAPWVLTVGASSHMGTIDRTDDSMAAFSSRGPTVIDRAAKPDLVAPGVGIESLSAPDSRLYESMSAFLLSGTVPKPYLPYLSLSGTSMAAPVVAGTVALMLQANPALSPNAVKAILQYTSQVYPDYNALTQGAGFLNARGAVELARFFADPSLPQPATDGWSGHIIWGNTLVSGGWLTPDGSAWSSNVVWGDPKNHVVWGAICTAYCDTSQAVWAPWGPKSANAPQSGESYDVVWGDACGGNGCPRGTAWGSGEGDAVVWGSTGGDAVVWGSCCTDGRCQVLWNEQ